MPKQLGGPDGLWGYNEMRAWHLLVGAKDHAADDQWDRAEALLREARPHIKQAAKNTLAKATKD